MVGFLSPSHLFSFAPSFTSLCPSLLRSLFFFQHIIAWVSNLWQLLFSHFGIHQWSKQTSLSSPTLFLLGKRHLIKELTHWKRPWCWEGLKDGEEDDRGWDGWMASPTWWTWVWVSSGGWWWTGKPGVLQSMELQRVRHDWVTELNWTENTLIVGMVEGRRRRGQQSMRLPGGITDSVDMSLSKHWV